MRKFETQKQIKGRIYSRTTLIILLFILVFTAKGVFNIYLRNRESVLARNETAMRLKDLEGRKELLNLEISRLNENDGIEREIREKFNVVKPGENVAIIVPDEIVETKEEKSGFFERFWNWLW